MRRERNYAKKPHTASFLQTFHTATTAAQRLANAENEKAEARIREVMENGTAFQPAWMKAEDDETAAVAFVTGPAPVEAQAAVSHVRPTAVYTPGGQVEQALGYSTQPTAPAGEFIFIKAYRVRIGAGLISEKQAKWIVDIAERPSVTDAMRESLQARLEQGFARAAGSAFITKYKDIPTAAAEVAREELVNPGPAKVAVEVPAGRYAVTDPTDGVFKFFHLDRPTEGRWKGYTFLKVRASDDLHPIRAKAHRDAVIAAIAEDVEKAQTQYGVKLGHCYRCGRTLTDQTSRDLGIGPDCRSK